MFIELMNKLRRLDYTYVSSLSSDRNSIDNIRILVEGQKRVKPRDIIPQKDLFIYHYTIVARSVDITL